VSSFLISVGVVSDRVSMIGASLIEYPSIILCNSTQLSKFRTLISSSDISIEERARKVGNTDIGLTTSTEVPEKVAFDDSLFCFLPKKEDDNESDEEDEEDEMEIQLPSMLSGGKTANINDAEIAEKAYEEFIQALTDLQNTDLASLKAIIEETGNLKDDEEEDFEEGDEEDGEEGHELMET
jgi:hypothetical protein